MTSRRLLLFCFSAYMLLGALLFLRPHQETFIGLDSSAIRWMTHAMADGRPQTGVDLTMLQVPANLRSHFVYMPENFRLTRDRSFQVDDLQTCAYRPWFYPALSHAALVFDRIIPGHGVDFFLPSLALFFFIFCGWFMLSKAGLPGLVTGLGLSLSLPLLFWFSRGYYPEMAGLLLMAMTSLHWLHSPARPTRPYPSAFALGLALCLHPLLALPAAALFALFCADHRLATRQVVLAACCLLLGIAPLVYTTLYITQPYGPIFDIRWLGTIFQNSTLFCVMLTAALIGGCGAPLIFSHWGRTLTHRLVFSPSAPVHALRLLLALIPTIFVLMASQTRAEALVGLTDIWSLLLSPYGLTVAVSILASLHPAVRPRARAFLITVIALASVFLYLKGLEPFGLWSQRRLLPITIPLLVASLGVWRDILAAWSGASWKSYPVAMGFALAAIFMVCQFHPLYLLRSEDGANNVMQEIATHTRGALTVFDYHQYGSPPAALLQADVLALSHGSATVPPAPVMDWIAARSADKTVLWATAYDNPGLEQGIRLEQIAEIRQELPRLYSKRVFPLEARPHSFFLRLLRIHPIASEDPLPALDKTLDAGPLALRGPWGRGDIALHAPDGKRLSARWTREGSKIIGPMPEPGGYVFIELTAAAAHQNALGHQVMHVIPPWNGPALELRVGNTHTVVRGALFRPNHATEPPTMTGQYTLSSPYPYNPSLYGIHGFETDLGVLLHRVRMALTAF